MARRSLGTTSLEKIVPWRKIQKKECGRKGSYAMFQNNDPDFHVDAVRSHVKSLYTLCSVWVSNRVIDLHLIINKALENVNASGKEIQRET
jgi:hypothetical protein